MRQRLFIQARDINRQDEAVAYYLENAKIIRESLTEAGFTVYGGVNAPYIWAKTPNGMKSWDFFDKLLEETGVVTTPGSGFGPSGEGYVRFTAFSTKENTIKAMEKSKQFCKIFSRQNKNNVL